jgi:hypothetical protein
MKILIVNHKDINYEFRLLEQAKVIQITKDISNPFEELSYEMKWKGNKFHCNCPGAKFHGNCWHSGMVNSLCQQLSIKEPWARWSEELTR